MLALIKLSLLLATALLAGLGLCANLEADMAKDPRDQVGLLHYVVQPLQSGEMMYIKGMGLPKDTLGMTEESCRHKCESAREKHNKKLDKALHKYHDGCTKIAECRRGYAEDVIAGNGLTPLGVDDVAKQSKAFGRWFKSKRLPWCRAVVHLPSELKLTRRSKRCIKAQEKLSFLGPKWPHLSCESDEATRRRWLAELEEEMPKVQAKLALCKDMPELHPDSTGRTRLFCYNQLAYYAARQKAIVQYGGLLMKSLGIQPTNETIIPKDVLLF